MQIFNQPEEKVWKELTQRPYSDNKDATDTVQLILQEVKERGDKAILEFTKKYEGASPSQFELTSSEMDAAAAKVPVELKIAIHQARENIERFHAGQLSQPSVIETMPGIKCWRKDIAIEKVGLYIPGGSAPLFSTVLMLAIPAKMAGCREIILCTPASDNGEIHPAILYAAQLTGVTRIFRIGGAQAIAAMAYGSETVPPVDKIFGPGNQFVTAAKQLIQLQGISIDMPAGPSELCVLADDSANPVFVAADLLSQAEHGDDSQVMLVTDDELLVAKVMEELTKQIENLPRKEKASRALEYSRAIIMKDMEGAIRFVNEYAAEHLIICCREADAIAEKIINAGSVFIGDYSPESAGDYASGTNHTLPTNGFAKAYSGVSLDSFVKKVTFQKLDRKGLKNISEAIITMAEAEGLQAHANAVKVRMVTNAIETDGATNDLPDKGSGTKIVLQKENHTQTVTHLLRPNIRDLKPYSSARHEFDGEGKIFLDANENSFGSPLIKWYNRYPDPMQGELKKKIGTVKNIAAENIFLGNGSDECIDLLIRAFCEPGADHIIVCPPTYGMYEVSAHINNVEVKQVPLTAVYQLDLEAMEEAIDDHTKIIFICSPNNPTANSLGREDIEMVLNNFEGLVVIDEAYINYSRQRSFIAELNDYPNLVIMQTFSKAWGLAALRLGMAFASPEIISILNRIKPPYNINEATQELAIKALDNLEDVNAMILETVKERDSFIEKMSGIQLVEKIYPSDANFILVKIKGAAEVYEFLKSRGIIVRNRSNVPGCADCLRITVGTAYENEQLIQSLNLYKS